MSLIKLAWRPSDKDITVSFITDKQTWNDGLGKLLCAVKYLTGVGASRSLTIKDFYDTRLGQTDLKTGIDGDGHYAFHHLKINGKEIPFTKMVRDKDNNEIDIDYHKE